jgi:hypothetical protein
VCRVIAVAGAEIIENRVIAAPHCAITLDEDVLVLEVSAICFVVTLGPVANDPLHGATGEQVSGDCRHGAYSALQWLPLTHRCLREGLTKDNHNKVYNELAMPEFSATLLGLLGITAGTYIGFKPLRLKRPNRAVILRKPASRRMG